MAIHTENVRVFFLTTRKSLAPCSSNDTDFRPTVNPSSCGPPNHCAPDGTANVPFRHTSGFAAASTADSTIPPDSSLASACNCPVADNDNVTVATLPLVSGRSKSAR
jgi:hypothetical protein